MTDSNLIFLGRGAGFNPKEGNTSAYLRKGNSLLLIDCGETVYERITERSLLDGVQNLRIILSHLHSDHCGSLGTLALYWRFARGRILEIAVPEDPDFARDVSTLMHLYGVPESAWNAVPETHFGEFAGIRALRFLPTAHAPTIPSYSLTWEGPRGWVFYSADTCEEGPLRAFLPEHPDYDRIYMDATDLDSPLSIHLSVQKLAKIIPPADRSRVTLMHLNAASCVELGRSLGFRIAEVLPAE